MLYFFYIVFIFVLIIGISDLIHSTRLRLFKTETIQKNTYICYLNDASAELTLRYAIEQQSWYGQSFIGKIIAINYINSADILKQCAKIADIYNIEIVTPEEFSLEKCTEK